MPSTAESPQLKILHVLTLNGRNGEYGGPVRVARELCTEFNARGHLTHLFSGAIRGSEPSPQPGLVESYVLVKPVTRKFVPSSLWSWKLIKPLNLLIKEFEIIHIHFARDLIPFLATILSILHRKSFITQTHGMISDDRPSTRIADFVLTKRLINKSQAVLVLTRFEYNAIERFGLNSRIQILPNGIGSNIGVAKPMLSIKRVAFCSRLDERKGIEKFIELADIFRSAGIQFEIYGPDGGQLELARRELKRRNLSKVVEYKGALLAQEVQELLREIDLLVLPSRDDNFPMVILEALSVGTPVLVMPSCGFAEKLTKFEPSFVASSESIDGLSQSFMKQISRVYPVKTQQEIIDFCTKEFGISSVADQLLLTYLGALKDAK